MWTIGKVIVRLEISICSVLHLSHGSAVSNTSLVLVEYTSLSSFELELPNQIHALVRFHLKGIKRLIFILGLLDFCASLFFLPFMSTSAMDILSLLLIAKSLKHVWLFFRIGFHLVLILGWHGSNPVEGLFSCFHCTVPHGELKAI